MDLRVISLFEDLTASELARVERLCSIRSFAKQEEIYGERETTTDIFFILAGAVRVTSFAESGREVIFSEVPAGGIFGEFSAIDKLPRSATIVAVSDCKLARMPAAAFFNLLRENNGVCVHLVELLVGKIRDMSERVFELSALAVHERLRRELVRLADESRQKGGAGHHHHSGSHPSSVRGPHRIASRGGDARVQSSRGREGVGGWLALWPALDSHHRCAAPEGFRSMMCEMPPRG